MLIDNLSRIVSGDLRNKGNVTHAVFAIPPVSLFESQKNDHFSCWDPIYSYNNRVDKHQKYRHVILIRVQTA